MKKLVLLILACLLCMLAFASCGGDDEKNEPKNESEGYAYTEDDEIVNPGGAVAKPLPGSSSSNNNASEYSAEPDTYIDYSAGEGYAYTEDDELQNPVGAVVRPYPGNKN